MVRDIELSLDGNPIKCGYHGGPATCPPVGQSDMCQHCAHLATARVAVCAEGGGNMNTQESMQLNLKKQDTNEIAKRYHGVTRG